MGLAEIEIGAKRFQDARAQLEQLAGQTSGFRRDLPTLGDVGKSSRRPRRPLFKGLSKGTSVETRRITRKHWSLAVLQEAAGEMGTGRAAAYEERCSKIRSRRNTQALNNLRT